MNFLIKKIKSAFHVLTAWSPLGFGEYVIRSLFKSYPVAARSTHPLGAILCISWYIDQDPTRRHEYLYCLHQNLANPFVHEVWVAVESESHLPIHLLRHWKIKVIFHNQRPSFQFWTKQIEEVASGTVVIIANSDLYFDRTLNLILERTEKDDFFCLTRYNLRPYLSWKGVFWSRNAGSFDSFIFKTPVKRVTEDVIFGYRACDTRMAYLARQFGYRVSNPSLSIKSWHIHKNAIKDHQGVPLRGGSYDSYPGHLKVGYSNIRSKSTI